MKKILLCLVLALFVVGTVSAQGELRQSVRTVTIANGASLSDALAIPRQTALGLFTPAAWTAADITFDVSFDGVTYAPLFNQAGTEIKIPTASIPTNAARAFVLDAPTFAGFRYIKVRSGISGTVVAQGAARVITIVVRPTY